MRRSTKIVLAGGCGAGKTTFASAVSEIPPLTAENTDFGRISLDTELVLYLFGTPSRFWFTWDDISGGAIGAVVLVDTRRLADCFAAIDYFEHRGLPFVVALNHFDGHRGRTAEQVRQALRLDPLVPVLDCDARDRESVRDTLIDLVRHAMRCQGAFQPVGALSD
ncbi:hypothetical protein BC739_000247 [Kutzneria viridogrisea]|uniref:ATP-binding protein n=1 Tax=Kutzneria viridogrisea TaxID=47990 RepID=A0ABR6B857_9PSEU|nr:hypothetical protein [Kutzneria viridogrisea]